MKNNYSGMKLNISSMKSQNNVVLTQIWDPDTKKNDR